MDDLKPDLKTYIDTKAKISSDSAFTQINIGARQTARGDRWITIPVNSAFATMYWYNASSTDYAILYRKIQQKIGNTTTDLKEIP